MNDTRNLRQTFFILTVVCVLSGVFVWPQAADAAESSAHIDLKLAFEDHWRGYICLSCAHLLIRSRYYSMGSSAKDFL